MISSLKCYIKDHIFYVYINEYLKYHVPSLIYLKALNISLYHIQDKDQ